MQIKITPTYKVEYNNMTIEFKGSTFGFNSIDDLPPLPGSYIAPEGAPCYVGANGLQATGLDPQWVSVGIDILSHLRSKLIGILFSRDIVK